MTFSKVPVFHGGSSICFMSITKSYDKVPFPPSPYKRASPAVFQKGTDIVSQTLILMDSRRNTMGNRRRTVLLVLFVPLLTEIENQSGHDAELFVFIKIRSETNHSVYSFSGKTRKKPRRKQFKTIHIATERWRSIIRTL